MQSIRRRHHSRWITIAHLEQETFYEDFHEASEWGKPNAQIRTAGTPVCGTAHVRTAGIPAAFLGHRVQPCRPGNLPGRSDDGHQPTHRLPEHPPELLEVADRRPDEDQWSDPGADYLGRHPA